MQLPTEAEVSVPLEEATFKFWQVSRAWRGINGEHRGWTFAKVTHALKYVELATITNRHGARTPAAVARQAEELIGMAVKDKVFREGFNATIHRLPIGTNNVGHKTQAA